MTQIYSSRLMAQAGYTGTLTYLVPSGTTVVVRDIFLVQNSTAGECGFTGSAGQYFIFIENTTGGGTTFHYELRQVFEDTEHFDFVVTHGSWDLTVSGYILQNP